MNWPVDFGEWVLLTVCLAAVLYIVVDIVTLSWWRAQNLRKMVLYRLRHTQRCDHRLAHSQELATAMGEWQEDDLSRPAWRQCGYCGVEQRRSPHTGKVHGP